MKNLIKKFNNFFFFFVENKKEKKELRFINKNLNFLSRENEEFFGGEASVSAQIQSPEITS